MRIGLIARSDRTGLGNQTRNLARMLKPDEILLIDSSVFNGNVQHPEMYALYSVTEVKGFPSDEQVRAWLKGVDVVITCEIFYNMHFVDIANEMGVKTINQFNWEFADYLRDPSLTLPTVLASPSKWNIDRARNLWGYDRVQYLPTPVFTDDFAEVRDTNFKRTGRKRFLHIMGRQAMNDRNGTIDVVKAVQHCREEFELVIKAQSGDLHYLEALIGGDLMPNVNIDVSSPENEIELYRDFDAMILPRRYAGQCLPMNEALCAGLPVIMTDISPNNHILPEFWRVPATMTGRFMARTWIDMYTVHHSQLGVKLDFLAKKDLRGEKVAAYNIGYKEFSDHELGLKWEKLLENISSR